MTFNRDYKPALPSRKGKPYWMDRILELVTIFLVVLMIGMQL
jgi:hypothetical protein